MRVAFLALTLVTTACIALTMRRKPKRKWMAAEQGEEFSTLESFLLPASSLREEQPSLGAMVAIRRLTTGLE